MEEKRDFDYDSHSRPKSLCRIVFFSRKAARDFLLICKYNFDHINLSKSFFFKIKKNKLTTYYFLSIRIARNNIKG